MIQVEGIGSICTLKQQQEEDQSIETCKTNDLTESDEDHAKVEVMQSTDSFIFMSSFDTEDVAANTDFGLVCQLEAHNSDASSSCPTHCTNIDSNSTKSKSNKESMMKINRDNNNNTNPKPQHNSNGPLKSILKNQSSISSLTSTQLSSSDGQTKEIGNSRNGDSSMNTSRKRVLFDIVAMREYDVTLGDHPVCSYGPPVTIDWNFEELEDVDVDKFENIRQKERRKLKQMVLSYYHQKDVLINQMGFTEQDLKMASRRVNKIKRQRSITRTLMPVCKVEEAAASAKRKFQRAMMKKDENLQ